MSDYTYDAFISYSSNDRDWAKKLKNALVNKGVNDKRIFFDQDRLDIGKPWDDQLKEALNKSHHMIVVWSDNADASDWVRAETTYFNFSAPKETDNKMIILTLQGESKVFKNLQTLNDLKDKDIYSNGAAQVDANLWTKTVQKIYDSIANQKNSKPIRLAILTTTRPALEQLDFTKAPRGVQTLNDVIAQLGTTREALLDNYGNTTYDWKPFGGKMNIISTLTEFLDDINRIKEVRDAKKSFHWEFADLSKLWSGNDDEIDEEIEKLTNNPSVIVVDPIALYDETVWSIFSYFEPCYRNKEGLIMTFSPIQFSDDYLSWRYIIRQRARKLYLSFFEPIPKSNVIAQCYANPVDKDDAKRLLKFVVGNQLGGDQASLPSQPVYLDI